LSVAARNGFIALLGRGGDPAHEIKAMGDVYARAAAEAGRNRSRGLFRVAHHLHLSDTDEQARAELRATMGPKLEEQKRAVHSDMLSRWMRPGDSVNDITFDYLVDAGYYFVGDPDTVYQRIRDFYEQSGGFGVLLIIAGQGHTSRDQWEHSMRLFAEHVAPRLAALDPDAIPVASQATHATGATAGP
jgi:alkanesulfonate monooxygenase SsuD/methylene tetrahydromethanopterin reductase-like flavin-dependent oxidoreductase (luciferase family)